MKMIGDNRHAEAEKSSCVLILELNARNKPNRNIFEYNIKNISIGLDKHPGPVVFSNRGRGLRSGFQSFGRAPGGRLSLRERNCYGFRAQSNPHGASHI